MTIGVLTALSDAECEQRLVRGLARAPFGVTVARRCVDVTDLMAAVVAGTGRVALVDPDVRRLDAPAVASLHAAGVAVIGLAEGHDRAARLGGVGVRRVVPPDVDVRALSAVVVEAVRETAEAPTPSLPHPAAEHPSLPRLPHAAAEPADAVPGRVVAVWGPTGAPGRSSVATGLATATATGGRETLLVDADVYGGALAQQLAVLDEGSGVAAAVRLATTGRLDPQTLAGCAVEVRPRLWLLTGLVRAGRWRELRPAGLLRVLEVARGRVPCTVVDCGFGLDEDADPFSGGPAGRDAATLAVLRAADDVVAVASADPLGLHRLVRGLDELRELAPQARVHVVVNRVRPGAVGAHPRRRVAEAVQRFAGLTPQAYLPMDVAAFDAATKAGRPLADVASRSAWAQAVRGLAEELFGEVPAFGRSSRRRAQRGR